MNDERKENAIFNAAPFVKFEVDGEVYYYKDRRFLDGNFLVVDTNTLQKIAPVYFSHFNISNLKPLELQELIMEAKESGALLVAKEWLIYAIEKFKVFKENIDDVCYLIPILTSVCRMLGAPKQAIEYGKNYTKQIPLSKLQHALYTSLAAAYLDLKDFENARNCINKSLNLQHNFKSISLELKNVILRLKAMEQEGKTKKE